MRDSKQKAHGTEGTGGAPATRPHGAESLDGPDIAIRALLAARPAAPRLPLVPFEPPPAASAVVRDGALLRVNGAFLRLFGYTEALEVIGTAVSGLVAPPDRQGLQACLRSAANRCEPSELGLRGVRADGSTFPIRTLARALPLFDGPACLLFVLPG